MRKRSPEKKRVTIADISRIAGVSKTTVSRVINNTGRVSDRTRQSVRRVMDEQGFTPNAVARGLITRRTMTIGLLVDDLANPFFMEVAKGIESVLERRRYSLLIASSNWDPKRELSALRSLVARRVDGLIVAPTHAAAHLLEELQEEVQAIVVINSSHAVGGLASVGTDNYKGGRIACRHLAECGRDRMYIVQDFDNEPARERIRGFRDEAAELGILARIRVFDGIRTPEQAEALASSERFIPDDSIGNAGIFALNDFLAMGIVSGSIERGLSIPEDVSIVGFDDIAQARFLRVPLTTIYQAKHRMGVVAAEELVNHLEQDEYVPNSMLLEPRLIVRDTTRPLVTSLSSSGR